MASIELILEREKNLSFKVPASFPYKNFFAIGREKHGDKYLVKISYPRKPRTTGQFSQNHKIAFLCTLIVAENAYEGYTTYQAVKDLAKLRAIKRGYPYRWIKIPLSDGTFFENISPWHEDELDTIQASYLVDELEAMAAEKGLDIEEIYAMRQ